MNVFKNRIAVILAFIVSVAESVAQTVVDTVASKELIFDPATGFDQFSSRDWGRIDKLGEIVKAQQLIIESLNSQIHGLEQSLREVLEGLEDLGSYTRLNEEVDFPLDIDPQE